MKKLYITLATIASIFSIGTFAQHTEKCGFNHIIDHYETINPGYKDQAKQIYESSLDYVKHANLRAENDSIYVIPVVVHVVYSDSVQNIPDSVIHNQIEVLNIDYMRLNADTVNLRDTFLTVAGKARVNFRLASYDPDGNPTTGITRTETTELFGEGGGFFGPDIAEIEDVKITANGGHDPWDQSKYLNIWVCDMAAGGEASLLGYATPPADLPNWPAGSTDGMSDGVVIQYQCFGSNNPNPLTVQGSNIEVRGRTTVHEVGHYLGLRHTAEQSWFGSSCNDNDDGLNDTPNMSQSQFDCNTTRNSCVDTVINIFGDTLGNLPDMIENYMDYSSETCQNTFSFGQVGIIRNVLKNYRNGLINNGNLSGVNELKENNMIVDVYPNPSNGVVQVNLNNYTGKQTIMVFNELGQVIYNEQVIGTNNLSLDLSSQPKGIYILKVMGDSTPINKKLVLR